MFNSKRAIVFTFMILLGAGLACRLPDLISSGPTPEWDNSPDARIITAVDACGLVEPYFPVNDIPQAQVWGDGRIIWTAFENGVRHVLTGQLSQEEMTSLLQKFTNAGFFNWDEEYANYEIYDGCTMCIQVNLANQSHEVCDYEQGGSPKQFTELFIMLNKGAGAEPSPYLPEGGTLRVFPRGTADASGLSPALDWPVDLAGFSLADVSEEGVWIEGALVEPVWLAANLPYWKQAVQEGDQLYSLALIIPGISTSENQ